MRSSEFVAISKIRIGSRPVQFYPTSKAEDFVNIGAAQAALGGGTPISYLYRHHLGSS